MQSVSLIPSVSRFVEAVDGRGGVSVSNRQTPVPQKSEVLVRMAAAPINPSDLAVIHNYGNSNRIYPVPAGREGAGVVVSAGSGILPKLLLGRRVAVGSRDSGTWGEFIVAKATSCAPLLRDLSFEQGSMILINPLTVFAIIRYAKKHGHLALVNTAANGAFGVMIRRHAQRHGIGVVNVVRRENQVRQLKSEGESYVLNVADPDFEERLRQTAHELDATLLLDAIGGKLTGQLVEASPPKSTILVYGNLSLEPPLFSAIRLLNDHKKIEGFFLGNWTREISITGLLKSILAVQRLTHTDFASKIAKKFSIVDIELALAHATQKASEGKSLLVLDPDLVSPEKV